MLNNEKQERLERMMRLRKVAHEAAANLLKSSAAKLALDPSLSEKDAKFVREYVSDHLSLVLLERI